MTQQQPSTLQQSTPFNQVPGANQGFPFGMDPQSALVSMAMQMFFN
jgi:hypothetical protein